MLLRYNSRPLANLPMVDVQQIKLAFKRFHTESFFELNSYMHNLTKTNKYSVMLDPVYTVPDPQGHDIKLNIFKASVALKFMIILQNLTTTNQRNNGKTKYNRKSTKLDS